MSEAGPRMLAIDIDGTLITSSKRIADFTRSEIRRVIDEYGVPVVLITARGPQSTQVIEERLGIRASYATFGGALVWARDAKGFTTLSETALRSEDVRTLVEAGAQLDVHCGLYSRSTWFVKALDYWSLREARNTAIWPSLADLRATIDDPAAGPFFKIMFRGDREPLAELAEHVRGLGTDTYIHHMKHVLEIFPSAAIKLPALTALADYHGVGLGEIIAFGDSASDIEMLENVGVGVLMGNAGNDLRVDRGVERTLSNDEDGVGISLRKHFPSSAPFRP